MELESGGLGRMLLEVVGLLRLFVEAWPTDLQKTSHPEHFEQIHWLFAAVDSHCCVHFDVLELAAEQKHSAAMAGFGRE